MYLITIEFDQEPTYIDDQYYVDLDNAKEVAAKLLCDQLDYTGEWTDVEYKDYITSSTGTLLGFTPEIEIKQLTQGD